MSTFSMMRKTKDKPLVSVWQKIQVLWTRLRCRRTSKVEMTEEQLTAADINGDSFIDARDASLLLSYYAYSSAGGNAVSLSAETGVDFRLWTTYPEVSF